MLCPLGTCGRGRAVRGKYVCGCWGPGEGVTVCPAPLSQWCSEAWPSAAQLPFFQVRAAAVTLRHRHHKTVSSAAVSPPAGPCSRRKAHPHGSAARPGPARLLTAAGIPVACLAPG